MKILKLRLFQETVCYKKPFAFKVSETYPLPPYSTIIGMFHKIIKADSGQYFPMNISVQGNYESIFSNYQSLKMFKKDNKITSMPRNVHELLNVNLLIHVEAEDYIIDKIYDNILNGEESFTLGRNEDIVRVDEIKIINDVQKVKREKLRYCAYVKTEDKMFSGINYKLNTKYVIKDDIRKWEKVNVKYVEKNEWITNCLKDEDGDLIFFYN